MISEMDGEFISMKQEIFDSDYINGNTYTLNRFNFKG